MADPIFAMIIPLSGGNIPRPPVDPGYGVPTPPDVIWGGKPPPTVTHPIVPPGGYPTPMPPIYYPPVFPAHPIAPGGPPVGPAHPIAPGGLPPHIAHPIAPGGSPPVDPGYGVEAPPSFDAGAEGGWVWSPYYGWVWQPAGSGGKPKPPSMPPPTATQPLP